MDITARLADDLEGAFPDLVRELQDGVYSTALGLCRHRQDAEDVTQETFVRVYRALAGFPADRIRSLRVRPYVWKTAVNLCRNRARTARRRPEAPLGDHLGPVDDVDDMEAVDAADEWAGRLALLTERQRLAVVLRHVADFSYEEVARVLGVPVGTAKADVHRGIARLRETLEAGEGEIAV